MRIARLPIPRRFCAQIVTPVNIPHGLETAMAAGRFRCPTLPKSRHTVSLFFLVRETLTVKRLPTSLRVSRAGYRRPS